MDPFDFLPDEVLEFLLSRLSPYGDLRNTSLVNRRFLRCSRAVIGRLQRDFAREVLEMGLVWHAGGPRQDPLEVSKRYSHSAAYDDETLAMYVFGGCTSTSTTFNDLWRMDLTSRRWTRPMATGTYPSPKACAVMVLHERRLILFGGWTHPSLYPLHQSWRLFNELHQFDISLSRWTHILPNSSLKPPSMAGHSATIHGECMVVFGGLHKQRSSIGQFSSSNDIWCFNLSTNCWQQKDIPDPRPTPRYGQSQLFLDEKHLLILGGCGGPNNIFTDIWLLIMDLPHWRWIKCDIVNAQHGASHMWCHPAVKVNEFAVVLGKNRSGSPRAISQGKDLSDSETAQFNVIPQLRRGMNRGYGSIRRQNDIPENRRLSEAQDMDTSSSPAEESNILVEPVADDSMDRDFLAQAAEPVFKTSVTLSINQQSPAQALGEASVESSKNIDEVRLPRQPSLHNDTSLPSTSRHSPSPSDVSPPLRHLPPRLDMTRMQAFASNPSTASYTSSSFATAGSLGAVPRNPNKQLETRLRQLDSLKKMEEKLKSMGKMDAAQAKKTEQNQGNKCMCHRLSMFVLDISEAIEKNVVKWLKVKGNASLEGPEETILYTLVRGRAELIMFGGIQKDVSSMTSRSQPTNANDSVSNSTYYLNIPRSIV